MRGSLIGDLPSKFGLAELLEKLAVSGKNVYNDCCAGDYIFRQGGVQIWEFYYWAVFLL